jgi:hypothetical protein
MPKNQEEKSQGAICGGVISETLFFSYPDLYMMAMIMPDDRFEQYKQADTVGRKLLFKQYAWSAI